MKSRFALIPLIAAVGSIAPNISAHAADTTAEATANGWHLTMKALDKPVAGATVRFLATFEGKGPGGTVYLEHGWYWFTNEKVVSCTAKNAKCLNVIRTLDASAAGVNHGVSIQTVSVPDNGAEDSKIEVTFTAVASTEPKCTFYTAAYRDVPTNPILVVPPAVRNFGCK